VRELIRKNARFFVEATLIGLALRLFLVFRAPGIVDDSRLYADIAKNWLHSGVYGITNSGVVMPTFSRLPGYPAFLAAIFAFFGSDNFKAVMLVQVLFDLATCYLVADMSRRLFADRAAKVAFFLAAVCPFLANYAASALSEALEIFFTALALDLALSGLGVGGAPKRPWATWLVCGFSVGAGILLRPDGGILLAAIGGYLLWPLFRKMAETNRATASPLRLAPQRLIIAGLLLGIGALAPLIPWTLRNLHTLHRFEPLAPRYANDSDEPLLPGFNRWVKTWTADYVSVQEIYWPVPGSEMEFSRLPNRAFDSLEQRKQTADLFSAYNVDHDMTLELDARFEALASERIQHSPLRYYVWLPALRIADMWLRPRTELFPSDPRWWEFNDDHRWLALSLSFGAINLAYVAMGAAGFVRGWPTFGLGMLLLFVVIRSAFLGTLENPEPRYTLECFPAVIVAASALFHRPE
jgi:4-amino-4-deoxy-L-arabinose transferase-like glycosyltransferase